MYRFPVTVWFEKWDCLHRTILYFTLRFTSPFKLVAIPKWSCWYSVMVILVTVFNKILLEDVNCTIGKKTGNIFNFKSHNAWAIRAYLICFHSSFLFLIFKCFVLFHSTEWNRTEKSITEKSIGKDGHQKQTSYFATHNLHCRMQVHMNTGQW